MADVDDSEMKSNVSVNADASDVSPKPTEGDKAPGDEDGKKRKLGDLEDGARDSEVKEEEKDEKHRKKKKKALIHFNPPSFIQFTSIL